MATTDQILKLTSAVDELDLYTWVSKGVDAPGFEALSGIEGFGMTDQQNRWAEGAGHGAVYLGTRILPRTISLPLWARERNRGALNALLSRLSYMMSPENAPFRLHFGLPGSELWHIDVVREGGGDIVRRSRDSNNQTWFKTVLELKAGDPYWSRSMPDSFIVTEDRSGRGLLPELAKLQVSFSGAFGRLTVNNPGDGSASPWWTMNGPFTRAELIGPGGARLVWNGVVPEGQKLFIDHRDNTVIDSDGYNRYDGLESSPKFWKLAPRQSTVQVTLDDSTGSTYALCQWAPRRWAVI